MVFGGSARKGGGDFSCFAVLVDENWVFDWRGVACWHFENRGDNPGLALNFIDIDTGMFAYFQAHIAEIIAATAGEVFIESFVVDIE